MQLANYAIPLFTLPCLTRALLPDGFGQLSFCLAFNAYFVMLVDYGFNYSATQHVSRHRDDKLARSKIFWSTLAVKGLLAILGLFLLLTSTLLVARLAADRSLLVAGYVAVIGSFLTPAWYFQGTEDLALLSGITVAFRLVSIPLTYAFVTGPQDLFAAVIINAAPSVAAGVTCLAVLARRRAVQHVSLSAGDLKATLADGWHLFLSTTAVSLYSTTNVILLGFVAGNSAVGYFSAAEKLARAAAGLMAPVSQSFYPRISRLIDQSHDQAFSLIRHLLRVQTAIGLALSAALWLAAPVAVQLLYGRDFAPTIAVLRWFAPLPCLLAVSNVLGVQAMLPLGLKRTVASILFASGAANVVLLCGLAYGFGATGAAASVSMAEFMVTGLMILALRSRRLPVFPRWVRT